MAKASPTQLSLTNMRERGYRPHVVEKWNPHARIRQDGWGVVDIVGLGDGEVLAVQATSYSNLSARVKKMTESEGLVWLRQANVTVEVHGWKKNKRGRWEVVIRDLS